MTDEESNDISPELLGKEVTNLAAYAATGKYLFEPTIDARTLLAAVQQVADAALARRALAQPRPVKPKQLAALGRVNTERLRQLPRTAEGYIAPDAARDWLEQSGVPGVELRRYPVTPSWWTATLPGDRLRRAAVELLRRKIPEGASVDDGLAELAFVLAGGSLLRDEDVRRIQENARLELQTLRDR